MTPISLSSVSRWVFLGVVGGDGESGVEDDQPGGADGGGGQGLQQLDLALEVVEGRVGLGHKRPARQI